MHMPLSVGRSIRLFWLLVAIDLAFPAIFLGLRFLQGIDMIAAVPRPFDIFSDAGLAERFNHAKWAGIAALMLALHFATRIPAFLAMAALFVAILADDAFRIHEQGSETLAHLWPDMPRLGMTAAEAGEVATWAALGLVLVPILLLGLLRTPRVWWPVVARPMAGFAGILAFAVGLDVAQQPLWHQSSGAVLYWGKMGMGLIEDTGEAVCGSLTLCMTADIWARRRSLPAA